MTEGVEMWKSDAKDDNELLASAWYFDDTQEFEVRVSYLGEVRKEKFTAMYVPRFGIDVADFDQIYSIADKFANELCPLEK